MDKNTLQSKLQKVKNMGYVVSMRKGNTGIGYLAETFKKKMPALVFVQVETRINSDEKEEFYYNEAYLLSDPSGKKLLDMISKDEILVDVRMHVNLRGSVRNHGTAFRTDESKLINCFSKKESLL